eukprot:9501860-Pyramimonas_sp.AAC.1
MEKSDVSQAGDESQMMDLFEHEEFYLKKKFTPQEITEKWNEAVKKYKGTTDYDLDGDNKKYPERVRVRVKTFINEFKETKGGHRAERVSKEAKSGDMAVDTDEGFKLYAEKNGAASSSAGKRAAPTDGQASDDDDGDLRTPVKRKTAPKATPSGSAGGGGGASGGQGSDSKKGDLSLIRLRAHDSWKSALVFKVQPSLKHA